MPENNKPKTYVTVPSGPLLDFDLSMVDAAWTGRKGEGGGMMDPGMYEWITLDMIQNIKPAYHAVTFRYLSGPGEAVNEAWKLRTQRIFFHFNNPEKKTANYYYGFLGQICPWCLWDGFKAPADPRTGKSHFWTDWFTGGPGGTGARVRFRLAEEEYTGKKGAKETNVRPQQGSLELLEPSSFAKGLLAVAGVPDWRVEAQPATMQQIGQIFANPQQVALAVQQGLAAIGQMPMMNLGGVTAPQFQAPQRQKPIA